MALAARLLSLVALAVAPALGVLAYNEFDLRRSREADTRALVTRSSEEAAAEIRHIVENVQRLSAIVAKLPDVRIAAAGAGFSGPCSDLLKSLRQDYPGQIEFGIANRDGLIVCTTQRASTARAVEGAHFKRAVERNSFVVGSYGESRTTGARYLTFAHPVRDEAGSPHGAVLTGLDLGWLTERIRPLVGLNHSVLSIHDRELVYLARVPDEGGLIGKKPPPEVQAFSRFANKGAIDATGSDGTRRVGAIRSLVLSGDNGSTPDLHVAFGLAYEAVFEEINAATRRGLALLAISAALAVGAGWYGGRRFIRRPIDQLLEAARRWRDGDYHARVAVSDPASELGRLAAAYQDMADTLAAREDERNRAEQDLRSSEERLRLAQDAGGIGLWDWDIRSGSVIWSDGYYRVWGLDPQSVDASLDGFISALHPDDRDRVKAEVTASAESGLPWDSEFRAISPDASLRWLAGRGNVIRDSDGQPQRMLGVCFDVTKRKVAEAALAARTLQLETLLETAPVAVWFTDDPQVRHVHRNRCAAELMRVAPSTMGSFANVGQGDLAHIRVLREGQEVAPSDLPLQRAIRGEAVNDEEYTFAFENGEERHLLSSAAVLKDEHGRVIGAVSVALDITARNKTEAALRESETRFRTLADSAPALIWMTDETGQITFANRQYEAVFGRPLDGMQGMGWREIVHPDDVDAFHSAFQEAFAKQEPFSSEVRVRDQSGQVRWLRCEGVPRFDGAHAFLGFTGCNVDITDSKLAEEHQNLLLNELNHRVKNSLATVQAIAAQTLRSAETPEKANMDLLARLTALARAHDVLTRGRWECAELADVVAGVIDVHVGRVQVSGPAVRLSPRTALALAMALHELATNAAKYGALSTETGHVEITWLLVREEDKEHLHLRWQERGGPRVTRPSRTGFGSRLIERSLATELAGAVQLSFEPDGVACSIRVPLERSGQEPVGLRRSA